jgi:hypothetical protein
MPKKVSKLEKSISKYRRSTDLTNLADLDSELEENFDALTTVKTSLKAQRAVQKHMADSNKDHKQLQTVCGGAALGARSLTGTLNES